jgi:bisphosphoglycerate-dependent phosphoglycerate mutase
MEIKLIRHQCKDCSQLLSNCHKARQSFNNSISIKVLKDWRKHEHKYGSSIPTLIINKELKARELVTEAQIASWVKEYLKRGVKVNLELMLWGTGCNRYAKVKNLVEEIVKKHFPEANLLEVEVQDRALTEKTDGDMALMAGGRLFTFFGRIPARDEIYEWLSSARSSSIQNLEQLL